MGWLLGFAVLVGLAVDGPEREDVTRWLGRYSAGPDTVVFRWDPGDGLLYEHGRIVVPADGEWHETVPEFIVRHRIRWLPDKRAFLLEESHDRSQPWRHELRLNETEDRLLKFSLTGGADGGEVLVRTYAKEEP